MEMKPITLCGVPALAWGKDSDRRMLAVHGMMSPTRPMNPSACWRKRQKDRASRR